MGRYRFAWITRAALTILTVLAVLLLPSVSYAGGVAVVLDQQPADVEAGKSFTVSFLVRSAHEDRLPITGLEPIVHLRLHDSAEQVTASATPADTAGHYVATITLPRAGEWRWMIEPFGVTSDEFRSTQPPLLVRAPGETVPAAAPPSGPIQAAEADDRSGSSFYTPSKLSVAAGTTVRWTNTGELPHTVTAKDGLFASGTIEPGRTFEYTFVEPGTYAYYCEFHGSAAGQGQFGSLIVSAAPVSAQAAQPVDAALSQIATDSTNQATQQLPATGQPRAALGLLAMIALGLLGAGIAFGRRRIRHG